MDGEDDENKESGPKEKNKEKNNEKDDESKNKRFEIGRRVRVSRVIP